MLDRMLSVQTVGPQVDVEMEKADRTCPQCHAVLARKPKESAYEFSVRTYCGSPCVRLAHRPMRRSIARRLWRA